MSVVPVYGLLIDAASFLLEIVSNPPNRDLSSAKFTCNDCRSLLPLVFSTPRHG